MKENTAGRWNYKAKDDWRRWQWNQIAKRVPNHKRPSALVLYLPGEDNLEAIEAQSRGFDENNLVGMEYQKQYWAELKKKRVLFVRHDALSVISCWPHTVKVDVVSLDFMGGLTKTSLDIFLALNLNPAFSRCIVAMNFLRGRDPFSSWHPHFESGCHRGDGAIMQQLMAACSLCYVATLDNAIERADGTTEVPVPAIEQKFWRRRLRTICRPSVFSYKSKSGTQHYDSVVFNWDQAAFEFLFANPSISILHLKNFTRGKSRHSGEFSNIRKNIYKNRVSNWVGFIANDEPEKEKLVRRKVRRKIAAVLAERTKRTQPGYRNALRIA